MSSRSCTQVIRLEPSAVTGTVTLGVPSSGVGCAAIVFVLSIVLGGGIVGPVLAGLWHGAVTFGLTGPAGTLARSRRRAV